MSIERLTSVDMAVLLARQAGWQRESAEALVRERTKTQPVTKVIDRFQSVLDTSAHIASVVEQINKPLAQTLKQADVLLEPHASDAKVTNMPIFSMSRLHLLLATQSLRRRQEADECLVLAIADIQHSEDEANPYALTAHFAQRLHNARTKADKIFAELFPQRKLLEVPCVEHFEYLLWSIYELDSKKLWNSYDNLSTQAKANKGIADITIAPSYDVRWNKRHGFFEVQGEVYFMDYQHVHAILAKSAFPRESFPEGDLGQLQHTAHLQMVTSVNKKLEAYLDAITPNGIR